MNDTIYLVLFCIAVGAGASCVVFTATGCYHYIRNRCNQDNDINVINEVLNPNNNKKVHFDC
tara:strand:+ start:20062 stop:20247 length:186 start_codon:yes stop_codon:yes gene_type:complete